MNKLIGFGIAVALCMAAAGFGAYMALRQTPAAASMPVAGGGAGATLQTPADTTASAAASHAATPASTRTSAPSAAAVQDPAAPQKPRPTLPAPSKQAAGGSVSGGVSAAPPASQAQPSGGVAAPVASAAGDPVPPPVQEPVVQEPAVPEPPAPPQRVFEELVVSADSVIGLRIENTINSEVARVEDPVEARVTREVRVGPEIAIPTGARVLGSVIQVERGGKMKNAARIGVRFHTLVLPDSTRLQMHTEAVYREGKSPGQESAAKVGAATVGGAILGAIIGGGKGAAIGGAVGAAGGTGAVMAGDRNPAILTAGTALTIRLSQPVTIVVERDELRR